MTMYFQLRAGTPGFQGLPDATGSPGCVNRCGFCYLSTSGLAMPYQTRPVDDVVPEPAV